MKRAVQVLLAMLLLVGVATGAAYVWAKTRLTKVLSRTHDVHHQVIPVPWPAGPPPTEITTPMDPMRLAIARGDHLIHARYACIACHGADLSGGVMVDNPALGTWLAPNLTSGAGGVVANYTSADWDRAVRHGIRPDGTALIMPSDDFMQMSDKELSDLIAYIQSVAPRDRTVSAPTFGPLGTFLIGTGQIVLSADKPADPRVAHQRLAPTAAPTVAFGSHLIAICTGCHRADLRGGPIASGDPSWPPASNLTISEDGLKGWSQAQFVTVMRQGLRPDNTALRPPMSDLEPMARAMTDDELQALWVYLQSLVPQPTGT